MHPVWAWLTDFLGRAFGTLANPVYVKTVGGGSGGTASTFGASTPALGTAAGFNNPSGNMELGNLDASGNLLVAGTLTITPPVNASTNITEIGGAALSIGQQTAAASIPVILPAATITTLTPPTTVTVQQATAGNLNATVVGTVTTTPPANASTNLTEVGGAAVSLGQQAAAASIPVILPAATITTLTPPTTVTVQQATAANLNATVSLTDAFPNASPRIIVTVTGSVSSNTAIVAAVAGNKIKVCGFYVATAYSTGAITPIFTDGNGGTTIWALLLQAIAGTVSGANLAVPAPAYIFSTAAGNALYLNPNGQACEYSVSYFSTDAA